MLICYFVIVAGRSGFVFFNFMVAFLFCMCGCIGCCCVLQNDEEEE